MVRDKDSAPDNDAARESDSTGRGEREELNLSGRWEFLADRKNEGLGASYFSDNCEAGGWRETSIPCGFDACGPDMERYIGTCWFRRAFDVPSSMRGRRIVIRFEGVNYNASVWVNGTSVGENADAFLPFEFRIGDLLHYGTANRIVVRVDNVRRRGQFPLFEGWYGQGGILREVKLIATEFLRIERARVTAEPDGKSGGRLSLRALLVNEGGQAGAAKLRVSISDSGGKRIAGFVSEETDLKKEGRSEASVEGAVAGVVAWSPASPALYSAKVDLLASGERVDSVKVSFGFRRVEIRDEKILLNGEPVFLMGFNRHEDSPRMGMAVDLEQARADFEDMKRMGCNFVRFCHYPHHPGELDLCDAIGLLVMTEAAMNECGHVDHPDPNGGFPFSPADAPAILEGGKRHVRKMVQRDANHPSAIICSVGNESAEECPEIVQTNAEIIRYGRELDPTRLWTHVSNSYEKPGVETFYEADDLICINCYPTHRFPVTEETLAEKFPDSTRFIRETAEKLHRMFPGKPIMITEFGYPLYEDAGALNGEEVQAAATEAEFRGMTAPYVRGAVVWHYAHHPWAGGAFYCGGRAMSPYGYMSRDRKTRHKGMAVIERMFKERAARKEGSS